jgi:hypothetical protein
MNAPLAPQLPETRRFSTECGARIALSGDESAIAEFGRFTLIYESSGARNQRRLVDRA